MSGASERPAGRLVALHGHGDGPSGIRGWAGDLARDATLLLPAGPVQLPGGGLAWFSDGAEGELEALVAELDAALLPTPGQLGPDVVVGWSQGAAAALAYAARTEAPELSGVVAIAGWLPDLDGMEWAPREGMNVLLIHGADDEVVPVQAGKSAARALQRWGADVTWMDVASAHLVTDEMLSVIGEWIQNTC